MDSFSIVQGEYYLLTPISNQLINGMTATFMHVDKTKSMDFIGFIEMHQKKGKCVVIWTKKSLVDAKG